MEKYNAIRIDTVPELKALSLENMASLGYLALIGIANKYANTSEREICKEIGSVAADIIEPEFAKMDRRNLIEKKKFLEHQLDTIRKLKELETYERHFIINGKDFTESMGLNIDCLQKLGVPRATLKAANII